MDRMRSRTSRLVVIAVCALSASMAVETASAASAKEIDGRVKETLERFYDEVKNGKQLMKKAKGTLVFPKVYKAGFGIGGEYGEGALLIKGKTVDYYSTTAGSIGFQIGVQKKSIIMLFMDADALKKFRESSGWKAGVDASVALVELGAGGAMDTAKYKEPVIGFIFGQKGLMYNLTLEGAKITKLNRGK